MIIYIQGNGKMVQEMVMDIIDIMMDLIIKDNGGIIIKMVEEH